MQQVPFEGCHTYYREAKKIIRQFEKVCLRPGIHIKRNLKWQLKKEKKQVTMALKKQIKRGGKSDNTKETK